MEESLMRSLKRTLALAGAGALVAGMISGFEAESAQAAWEPKKPIEFIVMGGQGGGADQAVRFMQSIVAKNNLAPVPLIPNNKPGGSGAEGLLYAKGKTGDDYTLLFTLNSFYTTPMLQPGLGIDIETFTPIMRMAEDTFCLWVHNDSGINTVDEFVAAAKPKGKEWIMAGTGKKSEDELLNDYLNTTYGLDMRYVPYKGGGDVAKALAGKNANATVNNPSEALGFYQSNTVKPIACFTKERIGLFPDAPTFKELGKDFVYRMQRSVVGAPGMSAEAAAYYQGLFKQVFESAEWQDYMKKKALVGDALTGDALMAYWKEERDVHKTMLKEMGVDVK